jgi:BASS family bile acid:Na+ symporter
MLERLTRNLAPLTVVAAALAFLYPPLFTPFGAVFLELFAAVMFALGLVLERDDLVAALGRPGQLALGVATQYGVMPLAGAGAALAVHALGGPPALALGFVVVGCAPGAMASNVMVYLAGGAVAFSVAMTTFATLASPLLTPYLVEALGGRYLPIPVWPMMQTILGAVLLPLGVGMLLRPRLGRWRESVEAGAPALATLAIVVICAYAMAANAGRIAGVGVAVLGLVALVNALGYAAGWWLGRVYRFSVARRVTLAMEIGMQNAGLGVALALEHFGPQTALPGALFAVWCVITGAGVTGLFRRRVRGVATP